MDEATIIETHIVNDTISPIRLIDFITKVCNTIHSRSGIKKAIKRGQFNVDGKLAGEGVWLQAGQKIELIETNYKTPKIFKLPLSVVFEDEHISVVIKPSGYPVSGNHFKTIKNALLFNIRISTEADALKQPIPVHRLDSPTSGLLVIAKTSKAAIFLGQQFEKKLVKKRYRAIVSGRTSEEGIIDTAIESKKSITHYKLLKHGRSLHTEWMSVLDLFPETGRTHQLRIHLASIGFPILGDDKYGDVAVRLKGKGLFLSAVEISFVHPATGKLFQMKIKQPDKFDLFFDREQKRWKKYFK